MKKYLLLPLLAAALVSCGAKHGNTQEESVPSRADSISKALDYQMELYPYSRYRDVYKNFMQDFYGPGHILCDTAAASRYLRDELQMDDPFLGPIYEPTGYKNNFYRVNISVVRSGQVPYDVYFKSFAESVQNIIPPTGEEWMRIWEEIDSVIGSKGIHFINETQDREEMARQFKDENYVVHHSDAYIDSARYHYRIISRENFERDILPLLKK